MLRFRNQRGIEPQTPGWIPGALPLSYRILHSPHELLNTFILHLTHITSQHTAHCKLELICLQGVTRVGQHLTKP